MTTEELKQAIAQQILKWIQEDKLQLIRWRYAYWRAVTFHDGKTLVDWAHVLMNGVSPIPEDWDSLAEELLNDLVTKSKEYVEVDKVLQHKWNVFVNMKHDLGKAYPFGSRSLL